MFLILTEAQAASLRGPTAVGAELQPIGLADGERWVLPLTVRDDPAHASRHDILAALPVEAVLATEFVAPPALSAPEGGAG